MCVVCCGRNHFSYPSPVRQLLAGTEASASYSKEMADDAVLGFLEKNEEILDSGKFSEEKGISHDEMVNAIKSLNGFGFVIAQLLVCSEASASYSKEMADDAVLGFLEKNEEILDSGKFSEEKGISHDEMVNAIKSLNGFGFVIAQLGFNKTFYVSWPIAIPRVADEASASYSKEMADDAVLGFLEKNEEILDSGKFSEEKGISHDEMVNAIKSLNGFGFVIAQLLVCSEASASYSKEMADDAVLGFLEKNEEILDSGKFSEEKGISHDEMVNAIKSLNGFGFVIAQLLVCSEASASYSKEMADDAVLGFLEKNEEILDSGKFSEEKGISHDEMVNAIKSLNGFGFVIAQLLVCSEASASYSKEMADDAVLAFLEKNEEILDSGKFSEEKGISHDEMVNAIKSLNGFGFVIAQLLVCSEASASYSKEMADDAVLGFLEKNEEILDSGKFSEEKGISHDEMVNAIKSLNGFGFVIAQLLVCSEASASYSKEMADDAVLGFLEKNEEILDSGKFSEEKGISHDEMVNAIKSLNGFGFVIAQLLVCSEASANYSKEMADDAVLGFLEKNEEILDSGKFSEEKRISHDEMVNAIKSLNGFGFVIAQDIKRERWVLTEEGKIYATAGSPEVQRFLAIPPEGITQEELQKKLDPAIFKVGWPQAMKNKWVEKGKSNVSRKVQNVDDTVKDLLMQIQNGEDINGVLTEEGKIMLHHASQRFAVTTLQEEFAFMDITFPF
nr:phenylalanine--tRNA ligase alpha subunit, cytoplasmic [Ipomoea batatas]